MRTTYHQIHAFISRRRSLNWLFDGILCTAIVCASTGSWWPTLPVGIAISVALRQWVRAREISATVSLFVALALIIAWDYPEWTALLSVGVLTLVFRELSALRQRSALDDPELELENERAEIKAHTRR